MRSLTVQREIDAPAAQLWDLLTDPDRWPEWGPTVRHAQVDGAALTEGATGTVSTLLGVRLPFEITNYEAGTQWSWRVAGVPATDHRVDELGPARCRVEFGVPWPAAPYSAVCHLALRRLDVIATRELAAS